MRENSARTQKRGSGSGAAVSELKRYAMREFASVSEYIYYSLIFEEEYPELSELFERAARSAVERFRRSCALIISLGGDPSLNMQIRQSREGILRREELNPARIERILRSARQAERLGISALERASALSESSELKKEAERLAQDKNELAVTLERLLNS